MNDAPADPDRSATAEPGHHGPGRGLVTIRRALVGVGFIWLAAMSGIGAVMAASYGLAVSIEYLFVAAAAAVVSIAATFATLRTFGYR